MIRRSILPALVLILASSLPIVAGELTVLVTDRDGRALQDVAVTLNFQVTSDEMEILPFLRGRVFATSNENGVARLRVDELGSYEIHATPPAGYVEPSLNPMASTPRVTFAKTDESLEVTLALWRGGPLSLEMDIAEGSGHHRGQAQIRGLDGEIAREISLEENVAAEMVLLPGRYELSLTPPAGMLLMDLATSEQRLAAGKVLVEIEEGWTSRHVHWKVGASARIEGELTCETKDSCASPVAELIEAGPWAEHLQERGGWELRRVKGHFTDRSRTRYEMTLPEGRWRVSVAEEGLASEPEFVDIVIGPGEIGLADFRIRRVEESPCNLGVVVESPAGRWDRLESVLIGIWREEQDHTEELPLRWAHTGRKDRAEFRDLEPGSYRIVARHPHFRDGVVVREICQKKERWAGAVLTLSPGEQIPFEAHDEEGRPVREVALLAVEISPTPQALFPDSVRGQDDTRQALSDDSGRGRVSGLTGAGYELHPRMAGRRARELFVRIRDSSGHERKSALVSAWTMPDDQIVDLVVHSAARVGATLVCDDGENLPDSIDIRAFDALAQPPEKDLGEMELGDAELVLDGVTLGGVAREDVTIGPLDEGSYLLALRPYGFERWTWFGSDDGPEYAHRLATSIGTTAPAGVIQLPCAPQAEFRIHWRDAGTSAGEFNPRLATVHAEFELNPTGEKSRLTAEVGSEIVALSGIPLSEGTITARLNHPHLLPWGFVETSLSGVFERGRIAIGHFPQARLGGAMRVFACTPAVRITGGQGHKVIAVEAEETTVAALEPGSYLVAACRSLECTSLEGLPQEVQVEQGLTSLVEMACRSAVDSQ